MYKYGFLYDAFFILLIASVCEINEVNCSPKDDLPFWTRDPKYDRKGYTNVQVNRPYRNSRKKFDYKLDDARIIMEHFFSDFLRRNNSDTADTNIYFLKNKKLVDYSKPYVSSELEEPTTYGRTFRKQYPRRVYSSKYRKKRKEKTFELFGDPAIYGKSNENRRYPKIRKAFQNNQYNGLKPSRRLPLQLAQQADEKEQTTKQTTIASDDATSINDIDLSPYSLKNVLQDHFISKFDDVNITIEVLGRTVEYNDIILMRATAATDSKFFRSEKTKYTDDVPEKKIIFIVHGLTVMGFKGIPCFNKLGDFATLTSYYFKHLDKFDIFLMPMANPDGVAKQNPGVIWNKNMSPQSACPGVALDRNFDVAWNDSHAAYSSCNQLYPGSTPFSEVESQVVRDMFHKYSHKIIAYFHVHAGSYNHENYKGDAVLYPKGFTESQSDDDKYIDLRGEIDETMKNATFKVMSMNVDTLHSWYGKVAGTSVDYAATVYGIPYAMELVMQMYDNTRNEHEFVLAEVWRRVIDVIFQNIYKASVKAADANER